MSGAIFITSMSKFYSALRALFNPLTNAITNSKITRDQLARFMLDKEIGYGREFRFNTLGGYAAANRIFDRSFSKEEMRNTLRALKRKAFHEKHGDFTVWGEGGANGVRIHLIRGAIIIGHPKIYRIYKSNSDKEHSDHETDMFRPQSDFTFRAA